MKHYKLINDTIELCLNYYNPETLKHCLRVANYAVDSVCLSNDEEREIAWCIALCHDLLEDTSVSIEEIAQAIGSSEGFVANVIGALTRDKAECYMDYIQRLKENKSKYPYLIQLADMKDHLTQTDTLTDKLKEKYWKALPELL